MIGPAVLLVTLFADRAPSPPPWPVSTAAPSIVSPRVKASRSATPPALDGRLDDPVWQTAEVAQAFTQKFPNEAAAPTETTRFRVLHDDHAVYVGIDCQQQGTPVRAVLTRRDREVEADRVTVHIGSRRGEASAYQFGVNAAGVLSDALQFDDNQVAPEWDENWEAAVARDERGWSVELRIPLRILRFENAPVQDWAFNVRRVISLRQEIDEWAYIPRTEAAEVSRYGRLENLLDLRPQRPLELRPFVLAKLSYLQPGFSPEEGFQPAGAAGMDLKWHASGELTLEATVLPDFGQVEVDQAVLNLTNMETFYEEKRPFFIEGLDLFATPLNLLHTRRIGELPGDPALPPGEDPAEMLEPSHIYGALKLTGRATSQLDVGLLSAVTGENTIATRPADGAAGPDTERVAAPLSTYNVLRLRRRWAGRNHFGLLVTAVNRWERSADYPSVPASEAAPGAPADRALCPDGDRLVAGQRCFHDGYVAAADSRWRSASGDYMASGQFALSLVQGGPPRVFPDGTVISSGDIDREFRVEANKEGGEHWLGGAWSSSTGRRFDRNDLGYMRRQNDFWMGAYLNYRTTQPWWGTLSTETGPSVSQGMNLDGTIVDRQIELGTEWQLRSFWTVELGLEHQPTRFDDREIGDGSPLERAPIWGASLELESDPRQAVQGSLELDADFRPGGRDLSLTGNLLVRALPELDFELLPEITVSQGDVRFVGEGMTGERVFGKIDAAAVGSTLRATYTFTPRLSLQSYLQVFLARVSYDDYWGRPAPTAGGRSTVYLRELTTPATPTRDPRQREALMNVNLVLRWEYRLGSTLFVVYTRAQNAEEVPAFGPAPRLDLRALGRGPAGDTLLLKLSRWWG